MGVDDAQCPFLLLEIVETEEQDNVFQNIREIPRMIDMAIVQNMPPFTPENFCRSAIYSSCPR
jgi:hypothetical protein